MAQKPAGAVFCRNAREENKNACSRGGCGGSTWERANKSPMPSTSEASRCGGKQGETRTGDWLSPVFFVHLTGAGLHRPAREGVERGCGSRRCFHFKRSRSSRPPTVATREE